MAATNWTPSSSTATGYTSSSLSSTRYFTGRYINNVYVETGTPMGLLLSLTYTFRVDPTDWTKETTNSANWTKTNINSTNWS